MDATPRFREPVPADVARCFEIESTSYEGDEAATFAKIATRIATYPQGFLVMEIDSRIVGFINSGCAWNVEMADEAFKELVGHDPAAPNVVVMSVVIEPAFQGRGLSTPMMARFVAKMRQAGKSTIHLVSRDRHMGLYARQGFEYVRPSESSYGGKAWHEMRMQL